jgi:hypothetical protein
MAFLVCCSAEKYEPVVTKTASKSMTPMAAEAIKARVTSPAVKLPLARRGLGVTDPFVMR